MTKRLSRWFPSSRAMWIETRETDLLGQDFNTRIVPYRDKPEPYTIASEGMDWYKVNESLGLGSSRSGVREFIRVIASRLIVSHEAWLEISYNGHSPNSAPFAIDLVDGVTKTATGGLVQRLPGKNEVPQLYTDNEWGTEIELDATRMIQVSLPVDYPSKLLSKVVRSLAEIRDEIVPKWVEERIFSQDRRGPPFDIREHFRTRQLRIAQAALPIGWTARQIYHSPNEQVGTPYFHYWRELKFLHFLSSMRERAEEALRRALTIAGESCGFTASVTANALYAPSEVEDIIRRFEQGEILLSEVSNIILEENNDAEKRSRRVV